MSLLLCQVVREEGEAWFGPIASQAEPTQAQDSQYDRHGDDHNSDELAGGNPPHRIGNQLVEAILLFKPYEASVHGLQDLFHWRQRRRGQVLEGDIETRLKN